MTLEEMVQQLTLAPKEVRKQVLREPKRLQHGSVQCRQAGQDPSGHAGAACALPEPGVGALQLPAVPQHRAPDPPGISAPPKAHRTAQDHNGLGN